jgi:hypothetical protein
MEFSTLTAGIGLALGHSWRIRAAAVIAAFAIVLTLFVLVQQPADASTHASVAAAVVAPDVSAQIDFRQFVCPTLIGIRNAFASSPFFSFVAAAINPIIAAFGCSVS